MASDLQKHGVRVPRNPQGSPHLPLQEALTPSPVIPDAAPGVTGTRGSPPPVRLPLSRHHKSQRPGL